MDLASTKYPEKELREFISNKINNKNKKNAWCVISYHQDLSEDFIREFKEEVRWGFISRRQKLSKKFKYEFHDKIYLKEPIKNNNPKEVI